VAGAQFKSVWRLRYPLLLVVIPTLAAIIYYGLIAAPIYVSESKFIVRMASPPSTHAFSSFLQSTGITRSQDDTFSVQDFMQSRDALRQLQARMPIRQIYSSPEADWLARFPRFWESDTFEGLFRYFDNHIDVVHNSTTGITTLKTAAFNPKDTYEINQALLAFGGDLLNRMNDRAREDAVKFSAREVRDAEQRVIDAQSTITTFRNKELMIDPSHSSTLMLDLIGRLSAELATARARRAETLSSAPNGAAIPFLTSRVEALEKQIESERAKVVGNDASIAPRIASYERLSLAREFADKALVSASNGLDAARADARRQQLYLERVVEPNLPDEADQPSRIKNVVVIFLALSGIYLIGRLLIAAARDYANT